MVNVHAIGGQSMLSAAREGVDLAGNRHPFLIAVSVLTSMTAADLVQLGINDDLPDFVKRLAEMAINEGLDGLVCSAQEASLLRDRFGQVPLLVTPGIRPGWAATDDQKRIMTPDQAIKNGASYLVIGRPITQHKNPAEALEIINQSIKSF